jgi:hypothetical protein
MSTTFRRNISPPFSVSKNRSSSKPPWKGATDRLNLPPWRYSWYVSLKCWLTFTGLHGFLSRKTEPFIVAVVMVSNPTYSLPCPQDLVRSTVHLYHQCQLNIILAYRLGLFLYLPPNSVCIYCFPILNIGVNPEAGGSRSFLARGFFYQENWGYTLLRNVGSHTIYTAPHTRRHSSGVPLVSE